MINFLTRKVLPMGAAVLFACAVIVSTAFGSLTENIVVPDPWILNPANGHIYRTTEWLTWTEAEAQAVAWGGHLVTINNAAEEQWLLEQFFASDFSSDFWIGHNDIVEEGTWVWANGETPGYENWCPGEPNNVGEFGEHAANVEGYPFDIPPDRYCWNDHNPNYLHRGIVEKIPWISVEIDIKPGSDQNCINQDGHGVIPVAIITTDTFDVSSVDPGTVSLDGAAARVKGKSGLTGVLEDVDGDGDLDMVIQIEDSDGTYADGTTIATLYGFTYEGIQFVGEDTICIVP